MYINFENRFMIMNTILLLFGFSTIVFGIVLTYVLVASVFKAGQAIIRIQDQTTSLIATKRNEIINTSLIGGAVILIGVLITKKALRS